MVNQKRSLSSLWIKMEVLDPQPEKPYLITPGIGSFPGAGELLHVQEVVKNFENCPMASNGNQVSSKAEMIPPIPNSSTVIHQYDLLIGTQSSNVDSNLDLRKIKRLLANGLSAQRARQRKLEYIEKLKRDIKTEEARLSVLAPRLSYYEVEHVLLKKENETLKEMLKALTNIRLRKEAEYEDLKEELEELRRALNLPSKEENKLYEPEGVSGFMCLM